MRTILKAINDALTGLGTDARLVKGDGYFYFDSGEAANWLDKTVSVPTLSSRTVEEWMQEYHKLKQLNRDLLQRSTGAGDASRSKESRPAKSRSPSK
jgi:hypothetical protein